jgi:uncharacterized protein
LHSARALLDLGENADAVSRTYYAAFHDARALLLTLGEETRTHAGLERLVHRDLVRGGVLTPELGALFSKLQKFRIEADYAAEFVFTPAHAAEEVAAAHTFVDEARGATEGGGGARRHEVA